MSSASASRKKPVVLTTTCRSARAGRAPCRAGCRAPSRPTRARRRAPPPPPPRRAPRRGSCASGSVRLRRDEASTARRHSSVDPRSSRSASGKRSASAALCVTTTRMVCARAWRSSRSAATPSAAARSRLPVGSSQSSSRRVADQRPRQRRALLLAARELAGPVIQPVGEADLRQQRARARLVVLGVALTGRRDQRRRQDVLEHRALRQQRVILEHEPDVLCCGTPPARARASRYGSWPSRVTLPAVGASSAPRM